jgi:hypothetical protein
MSAADVIKAWSDELGPVDDSYRMYGLATAIQTGNPARASAVIVSVAEFAMARAADGNLEDPEVFQYFSDRTTRLASGAQQLFNADQGEGDRFTLTLDGALRIQNFNWNTDDTVELSDFGHNILGGFDGSIGNNGVPALWTISLSGQLAH